MVFDACVPKCFVRVCAWWLLRRANWLTCVSIFAGCVDGRNPIVLTLFSESRRILASCQVSQENNDYRHALRMSWSKSDMQVTGKTHTTAFHVSIIFRCADFYFVQVAASLSSLFVLRRLGVDQLLDCRSSLRCSIRRCCRRLGSSVMLCSARDHRGEYPGGRTHVRGASAARPLTTRPVKDGALFV